MPLSAAGLAELKGYEGCRLDAYQCPAGRWTIGYGDTHGVSAGMKITQAEADERLRVRVRSFAEGVDSAITHPMTQGQLDAMVSLAYNIGAAAFAESTLVRLFNAGDVNAAARQFGRWVHIRKNGKKVVSGDLARRRCSELVRYFQ